eukprot:15356676-Ditylum_brightwellii.AAC.1
MSPLLTARSNQLGPAQLADTSIAHQILAEQQHQISKAIASLGRGPSANTVENVLLNDSNLPGRTSASNIRENVLLNDSNAIVAIDFLESLQQQGIP